MSLQHCSTSSRWYIRLGYTLLARSRPAGRLTGGRGRVDSGENESRPAPTVSENFGYWMCHSDRTAKSCRGRRGYCVGVASRGSRGSDPKSPRWISDGADRVNSRARCCVEVGDWVYSAVGTGAAIASVKRVRMTVVVGSCMVTGGRRRSGVLLGREPGKGVRCW